MLHHKKRQVNYQKKPPMSVSKEPLVFVVDDDPHVNLLITATMKLAKCNPLPFHSIDECLNNIGKFAGKLDVATINGKLAEESGGLLMSRIKEASLFSLALYNYSK